MSVWADKVAVEPVQNDDKVYFRIGHAVEPLICELVEENAKVELHDLGEIALCVSKSIPYLAATLDRVATHFEKGKGVCELKWKGTFNQKTLREYWIQLQHQLIVTGYKWGMVAILDAAGNFEYQTFEADPEFAESYLKTAASFWQSVMSSTPPGPFDGSEQTSKALAAVFPIDNGSTIVLPWSVRELDEWWVELQSRRKEHAEEGRKLDREQKSLDQQIRVLMGDAAIGIADTFRYELITTERKGYVVKPSTTRTLRRKAIGESIDNGNGIDE